MLESGSFHSWIWRHISPITQLPMASINPISSASGMKSPGGIRSPCSAHASDERLHAQEMRRHAGRRSVDSAAPSSLARRPGGAAWRAGAGASDSRWSVEYTTVPPGPPPSIDTSPRRRDSAATSPSIASRGNTLMPSEALMVKSTPSRVNGSLKSSCTRSARSSTRASAASLPSEVRGPADQVAEQEEELVAALARNQVGVRVELSQPVGELVEQVDHRRRGPGCRSRA